MNKPDSEHSTTSADLAKDLVVDDEFRRRIPPISESERQLLRESLHRDGCREPLIAAMLRQDDGGEPKPVLLDGHNRYDLCEEEGIGYRVQLLEGVTTRDQALEWIDLNQLGRRNLRGDALRLIRGRLYNSRKAAPGAHRETAEEGGQDDHQKTSEQLAAELGVSERTIRRDAKYAEAVANLAERDSEIATKALAGEGPKPRVAIEAAKIIDDHPVRAKRLLDGEAKVAEVQREIASEKAQAQGEAAPPSPEHRYDVIVVDPPWRERRRGRPRKPAPGEVAPMGEAELKELRLPAGSNCHVFLWTPPHSSGRRNARDRGVGAGVPVRIHLV